jgi:hypothetical protein
MGTIAQLSPGTGERNIIVEPPLDKAEAEKLVGLPVEEMPEELQAILRGECDEPVAAGSIAFATWRRK